MAAASQDHYQTLGVPRMATQEEIHHAFRQLARRFHPDVNPGDEEAAEKFKRISEAYDVLGRADKRRRYDQLSGYWQRDSAWASPASQRRQEFSSTPSRAAEGDGHGHHTATSEEELENIDRVLRSLDPEHRSSSEGPIPSEDSDTWPGMWVLGGVALQALAGVALGVVGFIEGKGHELGGQTSSGASSFDILWNGVLHTGAGLAALAVCLLIFAAGSAIATRPFVHSAWQLIIAGRSPPGSQSSSAFWPSSSASLRARRSSISR